MYLNPRITSANLLYHYIQQTFVLFFLILALSLSLCYTSHIVLALIWITEFNPLRIMKKMGGETNWGENYSDCTSSLVCVFLWRGMFLHSTEEVVNPGLSIEMKDIESSRFNMCCMFPGLLNEVKLQG